MVAKPNQASQDKPDQAPKPSQPNIRLQHAGLKGCDVLVSVWVDMFDGSTTWPVSRGGACDAPLMTSANDIALLMSVLLCFRSCLGVIRMFVMTLPDSRDTLVQLWLPCGLQQYRCIPFAHIFLVLWAGKEKGGRNQNFKHGLFACSPSRVHAEK